MAVRHYVGNLFRSDAPAYIHGGGPEGKMDMGFNRTIRQKYPEVYQAYMTAGNDGALWPGKMLATSANDGRVVYSIVTQGSVARRASLDFLASGLNSVLADATDRGLVRVAMPRIASGLGGLEWVDVERIIERAAADYALDVEVWTLR